MATKQVRKATCRSCGRKHEAVIYIIGKNFWSMLEKDNEYGLCIDCDTKERNQKYKKWHDSFDWKGAPVVIQYVPDRGSSYVTVICPFCGTRVKAYVWSFHGSGKKCECGALLSPEHSRKKKEQ